MNEKNPSGFNEIYMRFDFVSGIVVQTETTHWAYILLCLLGNRNCLKKSSVSAESIDGSR